MIAMLSDPENIWIHGGIELGPKICKILHDIMPKHAIYGNLFQGHVTNDLKCCPPKRRPVQECIFNSCRGCVIDLDEFERDTQPLRKELHRIPSRAIIAFASEQNRTYGDNGITLEDISILDRENYFYNIINIDDMDDNIMDFLAFVMIKSCSDDSMKYRINALKCLKRLTGKYKPKSLRTNLRGT
jgi:hypothetical protein